MNQEKINVHLWKRRYKYVNNIIIVIFLQQLSVKLF